jgi:exopolysaccharide biosynthesis WecB/TagA/CpsF family protein
MRILYSCIAYDSGKSGISVCMREQSRALKAAGHKVTLIVNAEDCAAFANFDRIIVPQWARRPLFSMLYHLFILPFRIRKADYDFCVLGAANRRAFAFYPIPTLAIVHDLSQYHVQAKYDCFRMFYIQYLLPFFVRRATLIGAISRSTRQDLIDYWHVPEKKLRDVPDGLSLPATQGAPLSPEVLREKFGIRRPYLLYVSRLEHPGKNHVRLMEAFERLPQFIAEKYDLVMAGAKWPGADAIFDSAARNRYGDHFIFPGFVENDDMKALYAGAVGYVFPSLFEGFGLSLIEAMHYGIPCACSSTSSLGELGEGCALLFNPEETAEITEALRQLLTDEKGNAERIAAGKKRAAQYTWEANAGRVGEVMTKYLARRPELFGVPIDTVTMQRALEQIDAAVKHGRQLGHCSVLTFVNAHCLNLAYHDAEYRSILNCAETVWPDGSGVRLAGRLRRFNVPENVNGTDMLPLLCDGKYSLYLLGGRPGVAVRMMENLQQRYPKVRIVGTASGYFGTPQEEERIIAEVNAANPDLLLVAMGVPKQEKWITAHRGELKCGAAIGVGGLFDFYSGRIPRAPMWMRKAGLEWCYRLYQEPIRLFKRYIIGNPLFVWRVLFGLRR